MRTEHTHTQELLSPSYCYSVGDAHGSQEMGGLASVRFSTCERVNQFAHPANLAKFAFIGQLAPDRTLPKRDSVVSDPRLIPLYIQLPSQPDRKCQHACSQIRSLSRHGRGVLCKCTKRNPLIQSGTMTDHEIIIAYTLLATSSARSLVELNSFPTLPTIPIYRRG
jgi:hypothetical protein